jgi:hypothetical protein
MPVGMRKLRAHLALLRGGPSDAPSERPRAAIDPRQTAANRRSHPRLTASEVPFVSDVRLKFGPAVTLIDLSTGGAQIETTNASLQPGSLVVLEMTGKRGRRSIPATVRQCQLASLQPELVYRGALIFTAPLDLNDLGADSVDRTADHPNLAVESQRLRELLTRLAFDPSGHSTSEDVLPASMSDALDAALSTLDCPAGRRAGPALATSLADLFKLTADVLDGAPTATALVAAVTEQLRHSVPARAIRDTESFLQLNGSAAILVTIPSLDDATPVCQLTIEFADGCEPLESHFQLLKAGVQLIAIARELGRRYGFNLALRPVLRSAGSSLPAEIVTRDERQHAPAPVATSEYRVEKCRAEATLVLSSGEVVRGHFFVGDSARGDGRERVGDLLNSATGFFPFEQMDGGVARIVLYNLTHVVLATLTENEARCVPGYEVAKRHVVSLLLSTTQRIVGAVRAHLPSGHDRVSDWARDSVTFRHLETDDATVIVNVQHVIAVTEIEQA